MSWWDTKEWFQLKKEFGFQDETLEQGKTGGLTKKPTTFGGSLKLSGDDFQMRRLGGAVKIQNSKDLSRWAPEVMNMVASALINQVMRCDAKIKVVTWQQHIAFNHIPYRRDCRVCQEAKQQCSPHRKVKYPEGGILSVDVAGPMIPAYDQGGYQARYFLVGVLTWRFPKSATMMDQPQDERLEGDEPQIEANPEEEEPREIEDQPREAEVETDWTRVQPSSALKLRSKPGQKKKRRQEGF